MNEENFSPLESLQLIQSMIEKTRHDISSKAIYFLVWGWLTLGAFVGEFILKHIYDSPMHYYVWPVMIVSGTALTLYYGSREGKKRKVTSYVSDSIRYLWMGMGIAYFVLSMILSKIGWGTSIFPFFIMLYGLGTFVSGCIIKFKPLVIGGVIASGLAVGAAYVDYDYEMLFGAAAILISYIIPAYILRAKERSAT